ncbi:CGNR zinc finger domain-containing protein [Streptomyces sp. NPDC017979]|uniref:CGNR zinc finger domain-containing protein n=1 Tax=Streptomyces sp. NPDC017979 TaxID=3365024 RepID=UPI0037BD9AF6
MERLREVRQPGDRAVAPGRLSLVQSFVNSVNVEFGPDEFTSTERMRRWLAHHGLAGPALDPSEPDRRDAIALREALRALLRENNGADPDSEARAVLAHIARDCPIVAGFDDDGAHLGLQPALTDMRGVLATILAASVSAVSDGSWQRLKACREHRCEWAFYDRSRNRGSRWCSMAVCGTRAKMRTYREGKRAESRA